MCVLHISVLCTYNTPSRRKNQNVISTKILTYFLSVLHNIQYTIFRFSVNVIIYWHAKHLFLCIMHTHFCVVFIYFARAVNVCYFYDCIIFCTRTHHSVCVDVRGQKNRNRRISSVPVFGAPPDIMRLKFRCFRNKGSAVLRIIRRQAGSFSSDSWSARSAALFPAARNPAESYNRSYRSA